MAADRSPLTKLATDSVENRCETIRSLPPNESFFDRVPVSVNIRAAFPRRGMIDRSARKLGIFDPAHPNKESFLIGMHICALIPTVFSFTTSLLKER
jgi:hypothetical protein